MLKSVPEVIIKQGRAYPFKSKWCGEHLSAFITNPDWQWPKGSGGRIMVGRRGRSYTENMYEWPTDTDKGVRTDCGSAGRRGVGWAEEGKGGKMGTNLMQ